MSATTAERPVQAGPDNGGVPARRAVMRWALRMFRREWRQQLLVLALITAAVAAIVIGAAVATTTPAPANSGFGTAQDLATFYGPDSHLASQIASLEHRFGRVDVIENETFAIPGSINSYDLRAQNPQGPFGQPMLSLLSGHYPTAPDQVAVTPGVASAFNLHIGSVWRQDGVARQVVGTVQNPQSLLDEFALVPPGQVTAPTQVTVLFDAPGVQPSSIGPNVESRQSAASSNPINPVTIVLAVAAVGMLLIALVAVGGFTVLAQRRLRALGMLGALGATDQRIRLVVRTNGVIVGVVGAVAGFVLGLVAWLAYRPTAESDAHHLIGTFALPWVVIGPAMALAVVATYFASSRPARAITRLSTVAALSGRPAAAQAGPPLGDPRHRAPGRRRFRVVLRRQPKQRRGSDRGPGRPDLPWSSGLILLAPLFLSVLARFAGHTPIAARLALRDLGRYRARSGSALAAISLGVMIAVLTCVLTAGRYGNVLDYAGPNLSSNQLIVYAPGNGPGFGPGDQPGPGAGSPQSWSATAHGIASGLGSSDVIELESTSATLQHAAPGRSWSGPVYVATPQLLAAFGIKASQVNPDADILTMRPGLSGMSLMQIVYGNYFGPQGGPGGQQNSFACPKSECLANPVIEEAGTLPSGTSAPNTVITEHAVQALALQGSLTVAGYLIQAPHGLTSAQITSARLTAAAKGMSIETRSSAPSSAEILTYATVFGIALALGILAMSIGLIRSESAAALRTLTATGASGATRRTITAVTAGALALAGAVLGTAVAYIGAIAFSWDNKLDGLGELRNVPTTNLLFILVGMPLIAAVVSWLLAGREPSAIARQPLE